MLQVKPGEQASLQVIVFALVADGKNGDGVAVLDLEKRYITRVAEGDQQFAEEWRMGSGFPAAEGELPKECHASFNGFERILCSLQIFFRQERIKADDILSGFGSEPYPECHADRFPAFSCMPLSSPITLSASIYEFDCRARSREARPRSMNSFWFNRRSMLARSEDSMKVERVSPS